MNMNNFIIKALRDELDATDALVYQGYEGWLVVTIEWVEQESGTAWTLLDYTKPCTRETIKEELQSIRDTMITFFEEKASHLDQVRFHVSYEYPEYFEGTKEYLLDTHFYVCKRDDKKDEFQYANEVILKYHQEIQKFQTAIKVVESLIFN